MGAGKRVGRRVTAARKETAVRKCCVTRCERQPLYLLGDCAVQVHTDGQDWASPVSRSLDAKQFAFCFVSNGYGEQMNDLSLL